MPESVVDYIDLYCERVAPGPWGEPVNALTNLGFLLAAWCLWRSPVWRTGTWDLRLLVLWLSAIGVGSGLWHIAAQRWAEWADVIPILLFIETYLLVFLLRIARLTWPMAGAWFLLFQVAQLGTQQAFPPDFLNGSVFYLPAVIAALLIGGYMQAAGRSGRAMVAWASGLLLLSVTLRSIDLVACEMLPLGTHFLWHLLNAAVLYLLIRGAGAAIATR